MTVNVIRTRELLKTFDFKKLFIEDLGWEHHSQQLDVSVDGKQFRLNAIANKRGMAAFECISLDDKSIPLYPLRRKIDQQVTKSVREHIIIYTDSGKTKQIWQWVKREPGRPTACREHPYHKNQPGDALIQKLRSIAFSLAEEERLTIIEVTGRARAGFDVERITKKFYERFKTEHDGLLKFIKGIPDDEYQRWYASVMLNRLMFIYFIQEKGFLDNNQDYLRKKLIESKERGKDNYYSGFLCPLFFEGFAKKETERSAAINKLLGNIPYLNGGLFLKHQIEELHGKTIQIPDSAFEKVFDFFKQYQWHLDERPVRKDDEINPDVLGYIFEKYINQKQMGAYYTKEDITEYISKNTVIPFLFDSAKQKCKIAFEGENSLWRLLSIEPDRYIYNAVKHGMAVNIHENPPKPLDKPLPLPKEIAAGLEDVSKRTEWNRSAPAEYALPTEIWREVVVRRKRYEEVREKLAKGEIRDINDFITYNLDIRQLAQDVIETSERPELLRAFYHAIEKVTVLDPTCGSGAFLFAALNILEPLYEACLDRMQVFVDEVVGAYGHTPDQKKHRPEKYSDFKNILAHVEKHPNRRYFILKSIIVNNLYGVDIMEEAIEICKLRLFLKLVAQIGDANKIEPLPDIDFNIRAGNTLVGFATYNELKKSMEGDWVSQQSLPAIEEKAQDVDRLSKLFHQQQTELGGEVTPEIKGELRKRLRHLESELNRYLAKEYGVDPDKKVKYEKWLVSHKPFHWFIEFYGIIKNGGFDAIVGNPPYVEYSKVRSEYSIQKYQTEDCGNIYAYTIERSLNIVSTKGIISLIVPLSLISTERMNILQSLLLHENRALWFSAFDVYPCKLFEGAKQRLTIFTVSAQNKSKSLFTSRYNRWKPEERENLFPNLFFWPSTMDKNLSVMPKLGNDIADSVLNKMGRFKIAPFLNNASHVSFYVHRIPYNYIKAFDFVPFFSNEVDGEKKSEDYKPYYLNDSKQARIMLAVINSNLFFWWWYALFEGYHCGKHEIHSFPIGLDGMLMDVQSELIKLAAVLMKDMQLNKNRKKCFYKNTGDVVYDEFYPRKSKHIIDQIDLVLAKHYGLSHEESDFIINYDIKYRSGKDGNEEDV